MSLRALIQRPTVLLTGLLLAATVSACSPTATASTSSTAVTAAPAAAAVVTASQNSAAAATVVPTVAASATTQGVAKINLNTATAEQILTVPNAGNRMVREFQEYRPYTSILTFRQEIGKYVDAATVTAFEQYVYVPVDPNQSDQATLQQIPGVTADRAKALIAARPYASSDAFLAKLAETLTTDQIAAAKTYLQ